MTTRQSSRSPVERAAVARSARVSTSNPTYPHPADAGVTLRIVPSEAGAAGWTRRSVIARLKVQALRTERAFVLLARRPDVWLIGDLGHGYVPPALVTRQSVVAVRLDVDDDRSLGSARVRERLPQRVDAV